MARVWPNPDNRIAQIDRILMFLGRYAHQPASLVQHEPMMQVYAWAKETAQLLQEEHDQALAARGPR
jgi:hypothetical protein